MIVFNPVVYYIYCVLFNDALHSSECLVSLLNAFLTDNLAIRYSQLLVRSVLFFISSMCMPHCFCHSFDLYYICSWCPVIMLMTLRHCMQGIEPCREDGTFCPAVCLISDLVWFSHGWHSSYFVLGTFINLHAMYSLVEQSLLVLRNCKSMVFSIHAMKAYGEGRSLAPFIISTVIGWRWMITFMPWLH
jgi:hypothetical protein